MHVISRKALEAFWLKHPVAKAPLEAWYRLVSTSSFESFVEVFDVGGNNFRIISVLHFNRQKLYIREVFTHAQYDRWSKAYRSKKS